MMTLHLENITHWRDGDLRKLLRTGIEYEGMDHVGNYIVEVSYVRTRRVSGWGYFNRRHFRLHLPRVTSQTTMAMPTDLVLETAKVIVHEIGHNRGLRHKDMLWWENLDVSWAEGLVLRRKP